MKTLEILSLKNHILVDIFLIQLKRTKYIYKLVNISIILNYQLLC